MAENTNDLVEKTTLILRNAIKELEDCANGSPRPVQAEMPSSRPTQVQTSSSSAQLRASENFRYCTLAFDLLCSY